MQFHLEPVHIILHHFHICSKIMLYHSFLYFYWLPPWGLKMCTFPHGVDILDHNALVKLNSYSKSLVMIICSVVMKYRVILLWVTTDMYNLILFFWFVTFCVIYGTWLMLSSTSLRGDLCSRFRSSSLFVPITGMVGIFPVLGF